MTPHELEQGRALLAKASEKWRHCKTMRGGKSVIDTGLPAQALIARFGEAHDDAAIAAWLRNHAAELLDLAAIGMGRTCYDVSGEALEAERAHADRLAEWIRFELPEGVLESGRCYCGEGSDKCRRMLGVELLAAHAARRKETNDG